MMQSLCEAVFRYDVRRRNLARDAALVAAGSFIVAIGAKIQWPLWPAPMTLQPFAVLLVGAALGRNRGALALTAYLLEGAAGLPVFAGPSAGLGYFAGPTAGYLLAFPIAAAVVGALCERGWDRRFASAACAMAVGQAIILTAGFLWLALLLGPPAAWWDGVLRFLPGDVVKVVAAAAALPLVWRQVDSGRARISQRFR